MSAIGLVEDARGLTLEAGTLLEEAADAADDEGRQTTARILRNLRDRMDAVANEIEQQRTALR